MRFNSLGILAAFSLILVGCANPERRTWITHIDTPGFVSLTGAIEKANARAEEELARQNELHGHESWWPAHGFKLADYDKSISELEHGDALWVWVNYRYCGEQGVAFLGHPNHFAVWVNRRSGELKLFGGR